ncbi:unnamed protein product [Sphenostylis stenocarpa]|uniref:Uncharacterized protein n=1 Tax=Sphenostylis stenocarpa TaxID=92480 RepID=A0AA86SSA2_9FABA|nr:unnamed protein product [Sphenostylis stenocarpa]
MAEGNAVRSESDLTGEKTPSAPRTAPYPSPRRAMERDREGEEGAFLVTAWHIGRITCGEAHVMITKLCSDKLTWLEFGTKVLHF